MQKGSRGTCVDASFSDRVRFCDGYVGVSGFLGSIRDIG
jgi:hypothetical protein